MTAVADAEPKSSSSSTALPIRSIDAATGELLRELTLDAERDYQRLGRPSGPQPQKQKAGPTFWIRPVGIS